jgi:hypothetical protein
MRWTSIYWLLLPLKSNEKSTWLGCHISTNITCSVTEMDQARAVYLLCLHTLSRIRCHDRTLRKIPRRSTESSAPEPTRHTQPHRLRLPSHMSQFRLRQITPRWSLLAIRHAFAHTVASYSCLGFAIFPSLIRLYSRPWSRKRMDRTRTSNRQGTMVPVYRTSLQVARESCLSLSCPRCMRCSMSRMASAPANQVQQRR